MSSQENTKSENSKLSIADKIWSEIKDLTLDLFALPNQKVHMHAKRVPIHNEAVHLTLSSQAVLASLEVSLGNKYAIESGQKYVSIKYSNSEV